MRKLPLLFALIILIVTSAFVYDPSSDHGPHSCFGHALSENDLGEAIATASWDFKNSFTSGEGPFEIRKIVIDAGHGGKDSGCRGRYALEKNVVLNIALKLGERIRFYHPEIEVIYTRTSDVFIPLFKRIDIANKNKADLFISIHCNYINHKATSGTETYVMGLHRAAENLNVAKRENASILMERDYQKNYDGYDPNSPEGHIILSMFQNAFLDRSIHFADIVERSFSKRTPMKSRGVKQAGFVVLRRATMPSVLVEAGFLSNSKEERYLRSDKGQTEAAEAIAKGFTEFIRATQKEQTIADQSNDKALAPAQSETKTKVIETPKVVDRQSKQTSVEQSAPQSKPSAISETIVYKIQVAASMNRPIDLQSPLLDIIDDVEIRKESDMYKYLYGSYADLASAAEARSQLREKGFNGAFIVAYKGSERLKI